MKQIKNWYNCSHKERIARWENAARVLKELSPHAKRQHWNMGWWGEKTDCGTVACAAGHCGLDPWFRRRGLQMNFTLQEDDETKWWSTDFNENDVDVFFGDRGTRIIFMNGAHRSVSKVVKEINTYVKILKKDTEGLEGDIDLLEEAFPTRIF